MSSISKYLSLIKFSHTIFAMPFALVGFCIGTLKSQKSLDFSLLLLVVLCMVFARSAAMAFNRYLDRDIDEKNPRTAIREIPAGIISAKNARFFVLINCFGFILCTYFINTICFLLSPVALLVILGYSYTKRFTSFCHVVLGLGLSLAPIGAYLAVTGVFDLLPILYSMAVLLWVAGFDIIYALQDEDFDRSLALNSIPVRLGTVKALRLSTLMHIASAVLILVASWYLQNQISNFQYLHWIGSFVYVSLLFYQHTLVKPNDLSKVNLAFFTTNGVASVIFGSFLILDALI
jgi:4-hydroxybenzoate polyprenyltransferase